MQFIHLPFPKPVVKKRWVGVVTGLPRWSEWEGICLPVEETRETWFQSLAQEDPREQDVATHASSFAWRIRGRRSLAGYSQWGLRVRHDLETQQQQQQQ